MNSSIFALKTWLIILEIIQLTKYLLKNGLNTLNEIRNAEIIKNKKSTPRQKELLDLFSSLLGTILTDKTLKSESQKDENENEDDKNENENEEYDDDETMSQNKKNIIIKNKNDVLDEIIDKSKSFEEQIKSLKKEKILKGIGLITILVIKS